MTKIIASSIDEFCAQQNDPHWRRQTVDRVVSEIKRIQEIYPPKYSDISNPRMVPQLQRYVNDVIIKTFERWYFDVSCKDEQDVTEGKPLTREIGILLPNTPTVLVFGDCYESLHEYFGQTMTGYEGSEELLRTVRTWVEKNTEFDEQIPSLDCGRRRRAMIDLMSLTAPDQAIITRGIKTRQTTLPPNLFRAGAKATSIITPYQHDWKPIEEIIQYVRFSHPELSFIVGDEGKLGMDFNVFAYHFVE